MSNYLSFLIKPCAALFSGFIVLALIGCASFFSPKDPPSLPLLPPQEFGGSVQITQRVVMVSEESSQTLLAAWAVNKDTVSLVGLSPTGQRLLTLSYDGIIFKEEYSNLLEEKIPGRAVMSYMQLAHWPKESINKALAKSEWSVKFSLKKRSLSYNGRHVLDILFENSDDKNISSLQTHYPKKIQIISSVMALQLDIEMLSVSVNAAP